MISLFEINKDNKNISNTDISKIKVLKNKIDEKLNQLEKKCKVKLPEDYKKLLLSGKIPKNWNHGGHIKVIDQYGGEDSTITHHFYTLYNKSYKNVDNLFEQHIRIKEQRNINVIPIGDDPGGNEFVFMNINGQTKIVFIDHEYNDYDEDHPNNKDPDYKYHPIPYNIKKFEDFLNIIKVDPPDDLENNNGEDGPIINFIYTLIGGSMIASIFVIPLLLIWVLGMAAKAILA